MRKAIAKVTVKLRRMIYNKGTIFLEPFSKEVERELKEQTGTIELIEDNGPVAIIRPANDDKIEKSEERKEPETSPVESEKERKRQLIEYAEKEFGIKIHHATGIEKIEQIIEDARPAIEPNSSMEDDVLNEDEEQ